MRPIWRWIVNGKPKPPPEPITLLGEWSNPREEALVAMAAALEAQTAMLGTHALLLERFAVAAESVVVTLERAEARALEASQQPKLETAADVGEAGSVT